ncbi:unnamed protein product [Hymenolepis diminuta]|uniref:Uncharacterized protein n=1 Tax=Hymenolepis diminuta TaxID=6216 RepID=A0A564XWZ8_HYMDI|nr:unnamed protein product [Hymenolepis diminuta]
MVENASCYEEWLGHMQNVATQPVNANEEPPLTLSQELLNLQESPDVQLPNGECIHDTTSNRNRGAELIQEAWEAALADINTQPLIPTDLNQMLVEYQPSEIELNSNIFPSTLPAVQCSNEQYAPGTSHDSISTLYGLKEVEISSVMEGYGEAELFQEVVKTAWNDEDTQTQVSAGTNQGVAVYQSSSVEIEPNVSYPSSCAFPMETFSVQDQRGRLHGVSGCGDVPPPPSREVMFSGEMPTSTPTLAAVMPIQPPQSSVTSPLFSLWGDYYNEEKEQVARESRAKVVAIKHTSQRPCRGNTTLRKIYRPVGIRQLPATGRKTTTASLANVYTSSNSAPVGLPSHRPFEKIVVDATPATPRPQPPTVRHLPQQRQFKYTRLESAYMRLIAQQQSSQN